MTDTAKPPSAYEQRLCLFLDILGFKNHIDESAKSDPSQIKRTGQQMTVSKLYSALDAINKAMSNNVGSLNTRSSKTVTQFSDSIVVSYKLGEQSAVFYTLLDIYYLQIELIKRGLLVRGAITYGQLIHDGRFVFGPALNDAVELEKSAMYPRVILSQEIVDLGKKAHGSQHSSKHEENSIKSLLKQDLDGMFYVDYFTIDSSEFNNPWLGLQAHLIDLRNLIKRMSRFTRHQGIKVKHSWMRQKYNDVAWPLEKSGFQNIYGINIPQIYQAAFKNLGPFKKVLIGSFMSKDKLKEALTSWIICETWHTNHQLDKRKFHQSLETVFNTLGTSVSYEEFETAIDDLSKGFHPTMSDSYRKTSVENFAKEAEVIGSYLGNMTNKNS